MARRVRTWSKSGQDVSTLHIICEGGHTVLHHVTDDAKFVKVSTSALGTEWLLECDLNVVDVVAVPGRAEELVAESQYENVLDHLLAQVVINTEDLLLLPVRTKGALKLSRTSKVFSERLLNLQSDQQSRSGNAIGETYDDARNTILGVAILLQVLGDGNEDAWR